MSKVSGARVLPLFTDLIFVILAFYFLLVYARSFFFNLQLQPSFLLYQTFFLVYQLMALVLFAIRKSMIVFSSRISDYVYTLVALASPMFFRPAVGSSVHFSVICLFLSARLRQLEQSYP